MPSSPYSIVVGVDFSPTSRSALCEAMRTASHYPSAEVHALHVIPPVRGGSTTRVVRQEMRIEEVSTHLGEFVQATLADLSELGDGAPQVGIHVRAGATVEELLKLCADMDASLLVVGTHGREGLERLVVGSVAEELVRKSHCPLLVARPKDHVALAELSEAIEPPCPDCIGVRRASQGKTWWCDLHNRPRPRTHVYSSSADVRWSHSRAETTGSIR